MDYKLISFKENKFLSSLLFDVYELKTLGKGIDYTTTPNGIIGISVILSGKSDYKTGDQWNSIPKSCIYGLIKSPGHIRMSSDYREIAIGFKPFFFHLLTNTPMAEIVKHPHLPLNEVIHDSFVRELEEGLHKSANDHQVLSTIENFLSKSIIEKRFDTRLLHTMNLIYSKKIYNVKDLSDSVNLSSVALRKNFHKGIGWSPKMVAKILRFNRVIKSHNPNEQVDYQDLIYQNGYFDQSHLIREFKEIIGLTPSKYFENKKLTFDFYNYNRWTGSIFTLK